MFKKSWTALLLYIGRPKRLGTGDKSGFEYFIRRNGHCHVELAENQRFLCLWEGERERYLAY